MVKNRVFKCGLILCLLMGFGCSGNRFKDGETLYVFSFYLAGYDPFAFCRKKIPNFIAPYSNGINPSRICIHYQYYTCHISHYCKGDKKCEEDAAWWISSNLYSPKLKRLLNQSESIVSTKNSCEIEAKNCNSGLKNDTRCRNLSSEKYQKIVEQERAKNPQ